MIVLRNLSFARAAKTLVANASLQLAAGWKIGLIGSNGSGKSSFFALLTGALHAEKGDLIFPDSWVLAHVAQETPALTASALDFVVDGDAELRAVEAALAAAEAAADGAKIGALHARLSEIDGYAAPARAASLLHGLGFATADLARPVAEFSGGWRMRLNLARALMCRSDLLLLDEPTNHLDLDAVLWLEGWLKSYRGTLLMISHDRDFLDATVSHTLSIENAAMKLYSGNYSAFERQRAAQLALNQALYARQQREIAHLSSFIARFRAKATKARQAQSRIKALARMEEIAAAHLDTPFSFSFRAPLAAPDPLLVLDDVAAGYGATTVLSRLRLTLRPGERLALLGRNGAGKSTLIKLLAGELAASSGRRSAARGLAIGYFAQHQLEHLDAAASPLQHFLRLDATVSEQEIRDFLGGFDFRGDMASAACGNFSGGEKSRLALALLIWQRPNLLLLDEPTNHLDLEMREALTLALAAYEGTVVVVSHDRHLLRSTADQLWLVANGELTAFAGDLDDYATWLRSADAQPAPAEQDNRQAGKAEKSERLAARQQATAERQARQARRRQLEKAAATLEKRIAGWQEEKDALDRQLAAPEAYAAEALHDLAALIKRQAGLASEIEAAEESWLQALSELEEVDGE